MGMRSLIAALSLVFVAGWATQGCSTNAQKIEPETRGKRGESCLARNDCDSGLACLNGICAKNEFNIDVAVKQCTRVECKETEDCCGGKSTEAPDKCQGRNEICDSANQRFPNCVTGATCTDATAADICGAGTCMPGMCLGAGQVGNTCEVASDCPANTCVIPVGETLGTCSLSGATCTSASGCTMPTCSNRTCNCINPVYDPNDPICFDEDCTDICLLRCEDSLCVEDKSCKTDSDCLALGLQICDGGRCVECLKKTDCDVDAEETCEDGFCKKPCKYNEECPLFYACNDGDCVYNGCEDDRDCILAASRNVQVDGEGQAAVAGSPDDPRLYKCLASDSDPDHKTCKIPCENDGSCGQFQVCDAGYCKFVGCETDEQCRNYLGIANQATTDAKPYVPQAKCELPPGAEKAK